MSPRTLAAACAIGTVAVSAARVGVAGAIRTADRNRDGRADVWYLSDEGPNSRVAIDSNFDGRPDEERDYSGGRLIRLARDRNLDDRIDLVKAFDQASRPERSIVDIDFDGSADLLVLFQNGSPVFSKYAYARRGTHRTETERGPPPQRRDGAGFIQPLFDPFVGDVVFRAGTPLWPGGPIAAALGPLGHLANIRDPAALATVSSPHVTQTRTAAESPAHGSHSTRAPPSSRSL